MKIDILKILSEKSNNVSIKKMHKKITAGKMCEMKLSYIDISSRFSEKCLNS